MIEPIRMIPEPHISTGVSILAEKVDYAHKMMNIPHMWRETKGKGVKVAIIDTGVPDHVDLKPAAGDTVFTDYKEDLCGHSTHVGGIIAAIANNDIGVAGIAPECDDIYIAALDKDGYGTSDLLVEAIMKAVDEYKVDIINMSLGFEGREVKELHDACKYAYEKGVTLVAATGNENTDVSQPACYPEVIAVGAVDPKQRRATFSNHGTTVDFAAPGVFIYSTYLYNRYTRLDGTSMACPMIAGIAALIIAKHRDAGEELSPFEVKEHIRKIAFDLGEEGFDHSFGFGIPIFGQNIDEYTPYKEPVFGVKSVPEDNCMQWKCLDGVVNAYFKGNDNTLVRIHHVFKFLRKFRNKLKK